MVIRTGRRVIRNVAEEPALRTDNHAVRRSAKILEERRDIRIARHNAKVVAIRQADRQGRPVVDHTQITATIEHAALANSVGRQRTALCRRCRPKDVTPVLLASPIQGALEGLADQAVAGKRVLTMTNTNIARIRVLYCTKEQQLIPAGKDLDVLHALVAQVRALHLVNPVFLPNRKCPVQPVRAVNGRDLLIVVFKLVGSVGLNVVIDIADIEEIGDIGIRGVRPGNHTWAAADEIVLHILNLLLDLATEVVNLDPLHHGQLLDIEDIVG